LAHADLLTHYMVDLHVFRDIDRSQHEVPVRPYDALQDHEDDFDQLRRQIRGSSDDEDEPQRVRGLAVVRAADGGRHPAVRRTAFMAQGQVLCCQSTLTTVDFLC
jgi:hypothetical protein